MHICSLKQVFLTSRIDAAFFDKQQFSSQALCFSSIFSQVFQLVSTDVHSGDNWLTKATLHLVYPSPSAWLGVEGSNGESCLGGDDPSGGRHGSGGLDGANGASCLDDGPRGHKDGSDDELHSSNGESCSDKSGESSSMAKLRWADEEEDDPLFMDLIARPASEEPGLPAGEEPKPLGQPVHSGRRELPGGSSQDRRASVGLGASLQGGLQRAGSRWRELPGAPGSSQDGPSSSQGRSSKDRIVARAAIASVGRTWDDVVATRVAPAAAASGSQGKSRTPRPAWGPQEGGRDMMEGPNVEKNRRKKEKKMKSQRKKEDQAARGTGNGKTHP